MRQIEKMSGPSARDLAGHHLTAAFKHLHAAASFVREIDREDAEVLARSIERAAETTSNVRTEVEEKIP